jgi:NAD-dependent SIR2 family protein deacetylase
MVPRIEPGPGLEGPLVAGVRPLCVCGGLLKPDITFFGEAPADPIRASVRSHSLGRHRLIQLGLVLDPIPWGGTG